MNQLPPIDNEKLMEILEDWESNLFAIAMSEFNMGLIETLDDLITWAINAKFTVDAAMNQVPADDDETLVVLQPNLLVAYENEAEWKANQLPKLDYRSLSMALAGLDALENLDEADLAGLTNLEDIEVRPGDFGKTRERLKAMFSHGNARVAG